MNKIYLTFLLLTLIIFNGGVYANEITNVTLEPSLDITYFGRYKVTADISGDLTGKDVNLFVSAINGEGNNCWEYLVNGTCLVNTPDIYNMDFNSSTEKWEFNDIFPDTIYPEMVFGESEAFWYGDHSQEPTWRGNYHIFKFQNSFSMDPNMSFWVELNASPKNTNNSSNLLVYLVGKEENLSYFQEDWRDKENTQLLGTISRTQEFHHSHTNISKHHLLEITANPDGTIGSNNIDINNGEFFIALYSDSPNVGRGWDLNYLSPDQCNQPDNWFIGGRQGGSWTNPIYNEGCPDFHIHVARREAIIDGAKFEVVVYDNDVNVSSTTLQTTFATLPNLPPSQTTFITPTINSIYDADEILISWNPATDPNNDLITYNLYFKEENDSEFTEIITGLPDTTYSWDISSLDDGNYTLKGSSCDTEPLCTDFLLDGYFKIDREDDVYSLSSISLSSNNFYPTIAKNNNVVSLSFTATGPLDNIDVSFFSGGDEVNGSVTITNPDTNQYLATYTVNTSDIGGFVSFIISADNLDLEYTDTTDDSSVLVEIVSFSQGAGTTVNPYLIESWEDLDNVRYFLNSHFRLEKDLSKESLDFEIIFFNKDFKGDWTEGSYDLDDLVYHDNFYWFANKTTTDEPTDSSSDWEKHPGFIPIGGNSNRFTGSFDGNNKTISDLYIYQPNTDYIGLFGANQGTPSEIYDLNLENVNVTGRNRTGGLIGEAYSNSKISNVSVSGKVNGNILVGGIVGYLRNIQYLEKGKNTANVTGTGNRVGGISGESWTSIVRESESSGTITGVNQIGGLVGRINTSALITKSFSTGEVYGNNNVGGLLGDVSTNSVIEYNYSLSDVYGNENVGGLIGFLDSTSDNYCTVKDSYSFGDVYRIEGSNTNLGGFIGSSKNVKKFNNYSTGRVLWQTEPHPTDKGFLGSVDTGGSYEMSGNFWDLDTSFQTTSFGDALGKTTSEMKDITTFTSAGWNIVLEENYDDEIWKIKDLVDYPRLGWQEIFYGDYFSLSNITISSTNSNPNYSVIGDTINLSFTATGPLDNIEVNFFSGGDEVIGEVTITNPDNYNYLASYDVDENDSSGLVSFEISASNLDLNYNDTTDESSVFFINTEPIVITFNSVPSNFSISKAPLKYNKNFAYSFTYDDRYQSGYNKAFKYLYGGYVDFYDDYSPGRYFTDGAGNLRSFSGSYAIYSVSSAGNDYNGTPGYLTWQEIDDAYSRGWEVLHHGYSSDNHRTAEEEISLGVSFVEDKTINNILLRHFVIPGGLTEQQQTNLIEAAFNFGLKTAMRQGTSFTFFEDTANVSSSPVIVNNLDLNNYVMYRYYYHDDRFENNSELVVDVDSIYNNSLSEDKLWRVAFSHRVRDSSEGSMTGNFSWDEFKYLMDYIEDNYGFKGDDTVWFAGTEEVYDYLQSTQNIDLIYSLEGDQLKINFNDLNVDSDLRWKSLSLVLEVDDAQITSIEYPTGMFTHTSHSGIGDENALINLEWNEYYDTSLLFKVEENVSNAEEIKSLESVNIAQTWVDFLDEGAEKTSFQERIDAIDIELNRYRVDFGGNSTSTGEWNLYGGENTTSSTLSNLKNTFGEDSTISINVDQNFSSKRSDHGMNTGDDSGRYPDIYMERVLRMYAAGNPEGILRLSGLEDDKKYNIILFGSRNEVNNNNNDITTYTINSVNQDLNHALNIENIVTFENIVPVDGEIFIGVKAKNTNWGYGHLNVLEIVEVGEATLKTVENQTKNIFYETIQEAIDDADEGDIIFIGNKTYVENPIVNKSLTLRGESRDNVIIDGNNLGNVIAVNASNVTIESLTTTNSGSFSDNAGIRVNSGHDFVYLDDVNASSNNAAGIHVTSGNSIVENCIANDNVWGIRIDFDSNFTIRNCDIINNQRYDTENSAYGQGIRVVQATDSFIYDNNILSSAREGILLTQNSIDNNIYNNDINFSGFILNSPAINISNGSVRNILESNLIYDTNGTGINLQSIDGGDILENSIFNSSDRGINLSSSNDININLNIVDNSSSQNLRLDRSSGNTIYGNSLLNSNDYGLSLTGGSGVGSNNNIIYNNDINSNANGLQIENSSNNNLIYNNNILSNIDNGIRIFSGAGTDNNIYSNFITGNKWGIRATEGGNLIYDNYFDNWSVNAYLSTGANDWNISKTLRENILGGSYTGGNFWSDYSGNDRGDGFGDLAYTINADPEILDNLPLHSVFIESEGYKNLVVVGASLMFNSFGQSLEIPHEEATQKLRDITGINDLNVYGYGFSGLKMVDLDKQDENIIQKLEQAYQAFPNNDTLFIIDTGGNDITSMSPSRAYSLITPEQLEKFQSDLNAVFDKVNERNGDVIVADLTFRSHRNPLDLASAENFITDFSGSGPYIENEFRPRQTEHQPHFLNTDNRSVVDKYNFIRNHWTALLHTDGVHLNSSSYPVFRDFILERVAYLFTDDDMPDPVEVKFSEHSDLIIIDVGTIEKSEYNDRSATYHPLNFSAITNEKPVTTLLKTITGDDVGDFILDTTITDLTEANIGVSTNTILPEDENAYYKNWTVYSKEIMETALYFNEVESVTIKLTGLEINSVYDVNFVGSTTEVDGGNLNLKDASSLNEDEISTTSAVPVIGNFTAETNSAGELELTATSSEGRGYLSGISLEYIGPVEFEEIIVGESSDAGVRYNDDTKVIQIVDVGSNNLQIGNRSGSILLLHKAVYVFKLPEIPSGKVINNVTLSFHHSGRDGHSDITYEVDLRGIRYSSNNTVVVDDYNASGVLIQEGILNVSLSPPRFINTSETGSLNLANWINGLYDAGAEEGDYIFLRLEPDSIPTNISFNSFRVDAANISEEEKKPKLLVEYSTTLSNYSLSDITISSNNSDSNSVALVGDTIDLNFTATGSLDNIEVNFFSGGDEVIGPITIENPEGNEYLASYVVNQNDSYGLISFEISASNLDLEYNDTTDDSSVFNYLYKYTLTYLPGDNGSISGTTPQFIYKGEDGTEVEAVPDLGYYFVKWDDDLNTSKRTETNVQSNNTFTAIFQETPSGDVYYSPCVPSNEDVIIYDMFGVRVIHEEDLNDVNVSGFIDFNNDLLGYWNFENSGDDNSTHDNNLIFVNDATTQTPSNKIRGDALLLDGISQHAYAEHDSEKNTFNVTGEFTIEAWVKRTGVHNEQWAQIVNRNADMGFNLQHNHNNTLFEFAVRTNEQRRFITASPVGGIEDNVWYHVVGVYDGSFIRLYVDGEELESETLSGNVLQSSNGLFIGARSNESNVLDRFFKGYIDEVKLWNRALTQEEINRSYNLDSNNFQTIYEDLDEGTYTFRGCITNSDGDLKCAETREVTVNPKDPEITIISPEPKTYIVDDVLIKLNLNKITCNCNFSLNEGPTIFMDRLDAYNFEYSLNNLDDGLYNLNINCSDNLGNYVTEDINFAVDTVPPMIVLETPLTLSYFNYQDIDFNFIPYKDGVEDLSICKLFIGNIEDTLDENNDSNFTWEDPAPANSEQLSTNLTIPEGHFKWNAWCEDTANNSDWSAIGDQEFIVDLTPPVFTTVPANQELDYGSSFTEVIFIAEDDSGILEYFLTPPLNGFTIDTVVDNGDLVGVLKNNEILALGSYDVNVGVLDLAGNHSNVIFTLDVLDLTGPTIDIKSPENITYDVRDILIDIETADVASDVVGVWYNWNGVDVNYTVPISVEFDIGSNTLNVFAVDTFGNLTEESVTFNVDVSLYTLTILKTGTGQGIVTSSPVGIDCGEVCSYDFYLNEEIILSASAQAGSEFTGWSGEGCSGTGTCTVTMDQAREVTAEFNLKTYTVRFLDHDESVLKTEIVNHGSSATAPAEPTREGYTFSGWDVGFDNITDDLDVTAQYNINQYTITFDSAGGTAVSPITQDFGTDITAPANPTRTGYTFNGWSPALPANMPAENNTHTAQWTANSYDVTFKANGGDGADYTQSITFDTSANLTLNTFTRTGYTFNGWNTQANGSGTAYADQASFTMDVEGQELFAQWTINTYTVRFLDHDASVLKEETVNHGSSATAPADPIREGYTFTGWLPADFTSIVEDTNITAQYTINTYTVKFLDHDASVLKTETVNHGSAATAPADPIREGYTFTGWLPADFTNITDDLDVTAQYTINTYTVRFLDHDASVLKEETVNHGSSATAPENPTREGYTFTGWLPADFTSIVEDTNITAQYTINTYTVKFLDHDESVLKTETVNHGSSATAPADPIREGYTFTGWLPADFTSIVEDTNITAQYNINQYTLTYLAGDNGSILGTTPQTVNHGDDGSEVEAVPDEGYSFKKWSDDLLTAIRQDLNIIEDITVTAEFIENNLQETIEDINLIGIDQNNLVLDVNGDTNITGNTFLEGLNKVKIFEIDNLILEFDHNFSKSNLNLNNLEITKNENYVIVNLNGQLQNDQNKTIYLKNNNFDKICVKDQEIASINEVSSSCNGVNEFDFTNCLNGSYSTNDINCTYDGTTIKVSNLKNSAIKGTKIDPVPGGSSGGSSGGSGSFITPKDEDEEEIIELDNLKISLNKTCVNEKILIEISSENQEFYFKEAIVKLFKNNDEILEQLIFSEDQETGDKKLYANITVNEPGSYVLEIISDEHNTKIIDIKLEECEVKENDKESEIIVDETIKEEIDDDLKDTDEKEDIKLIPTRQSFKPSKTAINSLIGLIIISTIIGIYFIYKDKKKNKSFLKNRKI